MGLTVEQERDFTAFVDARGSDLLRTAVLLTGSRHAGEDLLHTGNSPLTGLNWTRWIT